MCETSSGRPAENVVSASDSCARLRRSGCRKLFGVGTASRFYEQGFEKRALGTPGIVVRVNTVGLVTRGFLIVSQTLPNR